MFDNYSGAEFFGRFEPVIGGVGHYLPIQLLYYDYLLSLHAEHLSEVWLASLKRCLGDI